MSKEWLFVFFVILPCPLLSGRKMKDYLETLPKEYTLRVGMFWDPSTTISGLPTYHPSDFAGGLVNVSVFVPKQKKVGEVVNGTQCTYDGMIGALQRRKVDVFQQAVRPDSTPCEPGHFLTLSWMDSSPRIHTVRSIAVKLETQDILYLWTNFNTTAWVYLITTLTITSIVFVLISCILDSTQVLSFKINCYRFASTIWNYFLLFFDMSPTIILPFQSSIVLWTSIVLTFYYGIHMILMSTLSTDLTAPIPVRTLDSLQDLLYDPEFNSIQPVVARQMNMYNVLKNSREGTDERVLFDKIVRTQPRSVVPEVQPDQMVETGPMMTKLLVDTVNGDVVIIENSQFVEMGLVHYACHFEPDLASSVNVVGDVMLRSMLSLLVSQETPRSLRNYLQFKLLELDEGGLLIGLTKDTAKTIRESAANLETTTAGIVCSEIIEKTYNRQLDLPWEPFNLTPFVRLIKLCLITMTTSLVILFIERGHQEIVRMKQEEETRMEEVKQSMARSFVRHIELILEEFN